ncbi:hypothetical protein HGRIS_003494 [Hohenbuehelia grisea]|uniref:Asl1-like glycosyl hydrolase catalytic domain-containing protein n=1 Tax=Hohenbuehelia grisea TaxID=104357 RepID=A0ABR3JGK4_9AGAR
MLWGTGKADSQDAARLAAFKQITGAPKYVLGYEEPDCYGNGSSGISVGDGVANWDALIAPFAGKGTKLGSPSMCKQADETWLADFQTKIQKPWDFTTVHINKNNMEGVKKDLDHYWNTYKKPIWVTEFSCVDDHNTFTPCTNQGQINQYIFDIVDLLEAHPHVVAYAYSDGMGLGDVWPSTKDGKLSKSGQAYLRAISKYH